MGPCAEAAEKTVLKYGLGGCSPRHEYGELNNVSVAENDQW